MFIKVKYGPTAVAYYKDFSSFDFLHHSDGNVPVIDLSNAGLDCDLLYDEENLELQRGCSKHEDKEGYYYLNQIVLEITTWDRGVRHKTYQKILFTGSAYLCNGEGKTVDVLIKE